MSKNVKRVEQLSAKLEQIDECLLIDLAQHYNNEQWGDSQDIDADGKSHFECDIAVGQRVEDYQVFRRYGIGIKECPLYRLKGEDEYRHGMDETYDEHYDDIEDFDYDIEIDWLNEFGQIWINCITGEITQLTRTNDAGEIEEGIGLRKSLGFFIGCDYFGRLSQNSLQHGAIADESYVEISVHPNLTKYGYKQFDGFAWDCEKSNENYGENIIETQCKYIKVAAMVVARRHGYEYDTPLWKEYVDLLMFHGMDIRNPQNICPQDLQLAFNALALAKERIIERDALDVARANRDMMARQAEKDRINLANLISADSLQNINYQKKMGKFFNLTISGGGLIIKPLQSVEEFYNEGTEMHHCVFSMGYYKKFTSLILSIKDEQGNRKATAEIDLNTMEIRQCYAAYDSKPARESEMREIIKENMPMIKKLYDKAA